MFTDIVAILLSGVLSLGNATVEADVLPTNSNSDVVIFEDSSCQTPQMTPDEVAQLIRETQTKDLNFVALADAESGLYNLSNHNGLRGIFQIYEKYHKLDDYCDPVEQVQWLEWKIDQGAPVEKLFPHTYYYLYE